MRKTPRKTVQGLPEAVGEAVEAGDATRFFPGPWKLVGPHFGHWSVRQDPADWDGQGYQHICSLPAMPKDTQYGEWFRATAELIASAPLLVARIAELEAEREAEAVGAMSAVVAWLIGGETGLSSETIVHVMVPDVPPPRNYGPSYPLDPSDFRRCVEMLDHMEAASLDWRPRLPEVAERYPVWRGLVDNWAELETMLAEEMAEGNRAPRTYARMRELLPP